MRFAVLGTALLFAASSAGAMPVHLVANRATYDLRLDHTSPGGAIAAHGRMVIQFRDTCDGWSTAQRMVADMTNADGNTSRTDFLVTAWESKDGKSMRFDVKNASGGKLDKEKRGTATLGDDGRIVVSLLSPQRRQFTLPAGTIFPSAQTQVLENAAARGPGMVKQLVFQGGDETDLYLSTAVIGRSAPAQAMSAERAVDKTGLLKNVSAWTTLISYFANKRSADLPDYEVGTRLYANGISGNMALIYTRYTLQATLSRLEPLVTVCTKDALASHAQGEDVPPLR